MFLTVIIPVFNVREYLACCLDSVCIAAGRFAASKIVDDDKIEVLFIDDGSTDGSDDKLDHLAQRTNLPANVTVRVTHQRNAGVSVARNAGLDMATGEWVAFLDADDTWDPDIIVNEAKSVLKYPDADGVVYSIRYVDEHGDIVRSRECAASCVMGGDDLLGADLGPYNQYLWSACDKFFRRSVVEKAHIRFCPGMRLGEDSIFTHKFLVAAGMLVVNSEYEGYNYLMRATSALHNIGSGPAMHNMNFFEHLYPIWEIDKRPGFTARMKNISVGCLFLGKEGSDRDRTCGVSLLVSSKMFNRRVIPFLIVHGRTMRIRSFAALYMLSPLWLRRMLLSRI